MWTPLLFIVLAIGAIGSTAAVAQLDYSSYRVLPGYIRNALIQKDNYRPRPHAKKLTVSNLTLQEVFAKIRDITRNLNLNAKKNGYKVDYKFRIVK